MKSIEHQVEANQKKLFIEKAKNELEIKSFYDKHIRTVTLSKLFTYALSFVSVVFGCIAVYSTALDAVGLNITLIQSLKNHGVLPYLLLVLSGILLSFFELGKHHFYKEGFLEYYRKTDDYGSKEFKFAVLIQIVSICLSFYGGYLAANELAGTEKTQQLIAIQSEYEPKISELDDKIKHYNSNEFKNRQGKTLYKVLPIITDLENQKTSLENAYKNAKTQNGVSDGFVAATELGTNKMIFILGGSQIAIEIFLTLALWWICYFKSRVVFEELGGIEINDNTFSDTHTSTHKKDTPIFDTNTLVLNEDTTSKKIGFDYPNKDTNELRHNINNDVSQHTQQDTHTQNTHKDVIEDTHNYIDLTDEKKRVRQYVPRINEKYTKVRLETLKTDIKKLAKAGYKVTIKQNGRASVLKDENITAKVLVQYANGKLKIEYL